MPNQEIKSDPVELDGTSLESRDPPGTPSDLVCPACGGVMWERRKGTLRNFRCHVGHAFSVESLLDEQAEEIEQMLWTALRTLKDRARIIRQLADEARDKNELVRVQQFEEEAQQALQRAELIRQAILMQEKE